MSIYKYKKAKYKRIPLFWRGNKGEAKKIILLLSTILLLASCCKKIPAPELSADQKAWQPYHEGQKIYFKSEQTGDTLSFYVESISHSESEGQDCSNEHNDQAGFTGYSVRLTQFGKYPESLEQMDYNQKQKTFLYHSGLSVFNNSSEFYVEFFKDVPINKATYIKVGNYDYYAVKLSTDMTFLDSAIVAKHYGMVSLLFPNKEWFNLIK